MCIVDDKAHGLGTVLYYGCSVSPDVIYHGGKLSILGREDVKSSPSQSQPEKKG